MKRNEIDKALNEGFIHRYRDPLWKDITADDGIRGVISCTAVQKLDSIKQNGPAYHIYPGAVHTRLSHSLGVYHTGRQIMLSLLEKDPSPFTYEGVRSFLIACLLHDIGHFPYAHSLKELSLRSHEALAGELILSDAELRMAISKAGGRPEWCAQIIDEELEADEECLIYRGILSGALDPDKLDYLNRDAFFCGVPYGTQDNGYIISGLRLIDGKVAIPLEAVGSVEHLLFSKYLMYRNVYWHKGVRSATAMIKKALLSAIEEGKMKAEELYFMTDPDFDAMARARNEYPPFRLIESVRQNHLYTRSFEKEYTEDGIIEKSAGDIYSRFRTEDRLASALKEYYPQLQKWQVVIDIPEPISFEADIDAYDETGTTTPFREVTKLFTGDTVKQFARALRCVSIFTPEFVSRKNMRRALEDAGLE